MRHDPASAAIIIMLRALKMYGMPSAAFPTVLRTAGTLGCSAQAVNDLMEQGAPAFDAAVPILSQLLKAETAEREVRSIAYQIKAARFPAYKDLAGFDFGTSEINEALVTQLHTGTFIDDAHNVVLIGGPGTGKTHIATALAVQAVTHSRKKARFTSTVDLVNALEQEKALNKAGQIAERLLRLDLVILDDEQHAHDAGHHGNGEWDTYPSAHQAARFCSTCSASSMSKPVSLSPAISASANGRMCSVTPK